MAKKNAHIDRPLISLLALLICGGALIFASAAFGLVARGTKGMESVIVNHLILGVLLGLVLLVIAANVDYRLWKRYAPVLFGLALFATALVFVPHIGAAHGGGRRWLVIAGVSVQPSEGLKLAAILMAAAYFSTIKGKVDDLWYGLGGFLAILALPAAILILQPDIGTLGVICAGVGAVFFAAGARVRDVVLCFLAAALILGLLVVVKPYIRDRVMTFLDPSQGQQAEGYQIKQSLIAIGSGGLAGRGFGQGVQKFTYLPEPMGDSIFAVIGEELGLVGSLVIICLYLALALRGLSLSARAPDMFGALLGVGISSYLCCEAFINIAAMLGVAPLTGIPLTFVSQGGSAMLVSLASAGVLLSISRATVSQP